MGFAALAVTLWLQIVNAIAWLALPVLAPQVALDILVEPSRIAQTAGLMFGGALLPTILSGALVPRFGPLRMLQVCAVFSGLAMLICLIGSWWAVVVCALAVGAGYGPSAPGASAILAAHTKASARGLIFSVKQSGVPIGGAIAGAMLPAIALSYDWHAAIIVCSSLLIVSAIGVEAFRRRIDQPVLSPARPALTDILRSVSLVAGLKAHPDLPRVALTGFSAAALQGSMFSLFVTFLVARGGMELVAAGLAFSALHLAGTVARPLLGYASDRIIAPQALLAVLGAIAVVSVMTLFTLADRMPYGAVVALAAIIGATASGWNGVLLAEVARLAPAGRISQVTASSVVYVYLGYTVGPLLTSMMVGWTGSYIIAFAPLAALLTIAVALFAWRTLR